MIGCFSPTWGFLLYLLDKTRSPNDNIHHPLMKLGIKFPGHLKWPGSFYVSISEDLNPSGSWELLPTLAMDPVTFLFKGYSCRFTGVPSGPDVQGDWHWP
jgi:hypothetical protein